MALGMFSWKTEPLNTNQSWFVWLDQHDNVECHKAKVVSMSSVFYSGIPGLLDLNLKLWYVVEQKLCNMNVLMTNVLKICNANCVNRTRGSKQCLQYLVESMPQIIKSKVRDYLAF